MNVIVSDYRLDPPDLEPLLCTHCDVEVEEWVYLAYEAEPDGFPNGPLCLDCEVDR